MYIDGKTKNGSKASSPLESPILRRAAPVGDGGTTNSCQSNTFSNHTVQKGLLWQQRDRLFSRWKERYFILTPDYLNCFRKATDSANERISDMGPFMFKVKLVDVDRVEWVNKKCHSVIVLHLTREGRILLRAAHGLEDWYESLEEYRVKSRKRREMLRMSHDSYLRDRENDAMSTLNSGHDDWLIARARIARLHREHIADSVPDIPSMATSITTGSRSGDEDDKWPISSDQRHSLLTNIDMNLLDTPPPSVPPSLRGRTPCRLNSDIFFMAGTGRQRASIAASVSSTPVSFVRPRLSMDSSTRPSPHAGSFRVPNMLQTTRGTANRYSYVEEKLSSDVVYSTYDPRMKNVTTSPS